MNEIVSLIGIGQTSVYSTIQILANVTINDFDLEILLHVLPDSNLKSDIMIDREILGQGFCVYLSATDFTLTKLKVVDSCTIKNSSIQNWSCEIDTDISDSEMPKLLSILNKFESFFIQDLPCKRVTTGQLEIRLVDPNRTVQRRPYRLSEEERKLVRA